MDDLKLYGKNDLELLVESECSMFVWLCVRPSVTLVVYAQVVRSKSFVLRQSDVSRFGGPKFTVQSSGIHPQTMELVY